MTRYTQSTVALPVGLQRQILAIEAGSRRAPATIELAGRTDLALELRDTLTRDSRAPVRAAWVSRSEHDADALATFAHDESRMGVQLAIARHTNTSPELLARLATNCAFMAPRKAAALNPAADPALAVDLLLGVALAASEFNDFLETVASRPRLAHALADRLEADFGTSSEQLDYTRVRIDEALCHGSVDGPRKVATYRRLIWRAFDAAIAGNVVDSYSLEKNLRGVKALAVSSELAAALVTEIGERTSVPALIDSELRQTVEALMSIAAPERPREDIPTIAAKVVNARDSRTALKLLKDPELSRDWVLRFIAVNVVYGTSAAATIIERFPHDDEMALALLRQSPHLLSRWDLSNLVDDPLAAIDTLLTQAQSASSAPHIVVAAVLKDPAADESWLLALPWSNCRNLDDEAFSRIFAAVVARLGDSSSAWEVFVSLEPAFTGTAGELALACVAASI